MNLGLTEEQSLLVQSFKGFFEKECPADRVRQAEPLGFDRELWSLVRNQGVLDMAVPSHAGGWGASLLDLSLIAEQHGRSLTPAPILEAQSAVRLLSSLPEGPSQELLASALAGERLVTLAPREEQQDQLRLVPGGAVATTVLFGRGQSVMVVDPAEGERTARANLGNLPLADVRTSASRVVASGDAAVSCLRRAREEWMILTATALVGLASRALELATEYARERKQFDVPIATFQAVSHRLADCAATIEGACLLCYDAAWSWEEEPSTAGPLPAMAFAYASQAANDAASWSLHLHGGYGFMVEYDVQLYFRRAKAWANVLSDTRVLLQVIADRLYGPVAAVGRT